MTKLLVSDFDSTIYNGDDYYKNIDSINNFIKKGNIFAIATGRHTERLIKKISKTKLNYQYLICNDGGIILDKDLKIIYQKDIPQHLVKPITNLLKEASHISDWYIDTGLNLTKDINSNANGIIAKITDMEKAIELLNKITHTYKEVHGYISIEHINITEKTVTKGNAIDIINEKLKLIKDNIYTIGDNINDVSMSRFNSYCMTNSDERLKSLCKGTYDAVHLLIADILKKE